MSAGGTSFRRVIAFALVALVLAASCSSSNKKSSPVSTIPHPHIDLSSATAAKFAAHGSVGQVYVTGAAKQTPLVLVDANGNVAASAKTDTQGSLIFRNLAVGNGYRVTTANYAQASPPVAVTASDQPPSPTFYSAQKIQPGYGYLTTRDGVKLAVSVKLPGPANKGPYPTVIEYSGYVTADPTSPQPLTEISQYLGYATVAVQIRGTGCSGGAFQYFEPLQSTDGYDAVEAVAAQPWVAHHKVGMVGISYSGITQLFVAQLRPPHLAAITPLSVIDDTIKGTLAPGGILNTGFAVAWAKDRQHDAQPAPGGQSWAEARIKAGDKQCLANQALHSQAPNVLDQIKQSKYWTDAIGLPLSPENFVQNINVPVYLAGAWQDEQTGGYFANLLNRFTGTKDAWFTAQNGSHTDSLDPTVFARWVEFLSIFVKQQVPKQDALEGVIENVVQNMAFGTAGPLPPDPFKNVHTLADAKQLFEGFPRLRILFENGAGAGVAPGVPEPRFEVDYPSWPIPGTTATRWYFGPDGSLVASAPTTQTTDTYQYDPSRSQIPTIVGGDDKVWDRLPKFNWPAPKDGTAVAYETAPLTADTTVIGNASVDLWMKSTAPDTDVQVTITEIRPDGKEMFVQNGWLRASARALAPDATELRPTHTFTQADAGPLPPGQWSQVRVEVFPFAYVFRKGSRIRVIIDAPGASRPRWTFQALPAQPNEINSINIGGDQYASSIVLPVIPGVKVVGGLPPCPSLRGEPCRSVATIS
jgi:predicted acyl esterase